MLHVFRSLVNLIGHNPLQYVLAQAYGRTYERTQKELQNLYHLTDSLAHQLQGVLHPAKD
jgi:hypothetical protein